MTQQPISTDQSLRKQNVLLWSPFGSGEHYCGPATYTHRVYTKLDAEQYRCSLAHGFTDQPNLPVFAEQFFVRPFGKSASVNLRFVSEAKKWATKNVEKFDLFHGVSGFACTVSAAEIAKKKGLPVVLFVSIKDGGLSATGKNYLSRLLGVHRRRQKVAQTFDAIIALSAEINTQLLSIGIQPEKIVRIPNFADTEKYSPATEDQRMELKQELGLPQMPTISFVGRICERKRPHLIIESLQYMREKGTDVHCAFVGPFERDDPYFQRLEQLVADLKLDNHVTFVGFTTVVEQWLKASDLFCLPSSNEGMPGALVEALACGLPSIASPFSSAKELIVDSVMGNVLTKESRPEEIGDAALTLLSDAQKCSNVDRRRQFVLDNYSLSAVAQKHSELFQRVLRG